MSIAEKLGYTPGAWTLYNESGTTAVLNHGDQRQAIIQWTGFDQSNTPIIEHYPNARLIAAAPQMLEALIDLMKGIDGLPQLTAIEGLLSTQWDNAIEAVESATGISWDGVRI